MNFGKRKLQMLLFPEFRNLPKSSQFFSAILVSAGVVYMSFVPSNVITSYPKFESTL